MTQTTLKANTNLLSVTYLYLPASFSSISGLIPLVLPLLQDKAGLLLLLLWCPQAASPLLTLQRAFPMYMRADIFLTLPLFKRVKRQRCRVAYPHAKRYRLNWSHHVQFPDHLLGFFPESLAPRGLWHFYSLFCALLAVQHATPAVLGLAAFLSHCQSLWEDSAKEKADTEFFVCQSYWSIAYYSCSQKPCSWGGMEEKVLFSFSFQLLVHLRDDRAGLCGETSYQSEKVQEKVYIALGAMFPHSPCRAI